MPVTPDPRLLPRLRAIIEARTGLAFDDSRSGDLHAALEERARCCGLSPASYLDHLGDSAREPHELAQLITVAETYFFRNAEQLEACMQRAVPDRLERHGGSGLRILSAACASGEEPFSLAMLLREHWPMHAGRASIVAGDLNPSMIERAHRGRFGAWSLRETPAQYKTRYFSLEGQDFVLDRSIREAVQFELLNLVEPMPEQLLEASYDLVFCRNVLMYFSPAQLAATVSRLARALAPGGYLFLGHAETLRGVSQDFHLLHTGSAFYYQRKHDPSRRSSTPARSHAPGPRPSPAAPSSTPAATSSAPPRAAWYDAIARSTDRIRDLPPAPIVEATSESLGADAKQLLDLLRSEHYTQVLSVLQCAPDGEVDRDRALMAAVVSAHAGRFDQARELCDRLLESDELNAGAHYVLALCHEHDGDSACALHHDQLSSYLDPAFAMPRIHMGLLYRRLGHARAAGRELREARRLLEREDASRLLLFGGGFGRSGLLALCDAELSSTSREAG